MFLGASGGLAHRGNYLRWLGMLASDSGGEDSTLFLRVLHDRIPQPG